ncbi:flagellar biosynthesis protein FlhB [Ideonella dechloratans]|uniref:Flagellar biosynthetic protein FlhB n=1 Tax=Ideonella dechloratans TaxID=36863 RepID=A0A643F660_IDEDE|nr:flagellar biosynthesis protein FlhB [Ideonella dechloratans]KAB0573854.1 flagellar biosynthesis protein FlhB [Ideonella dechloratans]UFU09216.1 flagellar biosynthesis protein FlhB [Ideonella dechloratans]
MADSAQDRNLPATAKRRQRAREDGQVPRSKDLGHFTALAVGGALLMVLAHPLATWAQGVLDAGLRFDRERAVNPQAMSELFWLLAIKALMLVIPMGLVMIGVGMATTILSGGWNLSFKPLHPNFGKFNPIAGMGRLFNKQHIIDVAKMSLLAGAIGTVGYQYLKSQFMGMVSLMAVPLPSAIAQMGSTIAMGFGLMMLVVGGWALIDVPLQRYLWLERLKMSREEVKQEHKDAEGNMEVKGKIKQKMREMARKRMLAAVPQADLVVMNPTHYAVALRYDDASMGAPRVVAKGTDLLALKIRDIAREAKVPVLQAPPLARALYAHVELDHEVPAALFAAVAQVLAWVYQLRARADVAPPTVDVPPELDPHNQPPARGAAE